MKRLKRALSVTKSVPRISESISEIDEYLKETHLETHVECEPPSVKGGSGKLKNNNTREGK